MIRRRWIWMAAGALGLASIAAGAVVAAGRGSRQQQEATATAQKEVDPPKDAPAPAEASWGTLRGRLTFDGDPPPARVLVKKDDPYAKDGSALSQDGPIVSDRLVVDAKTRGVRYALVYLVRPSAIKPELREPDPLVVASVRLTHGRIEPHVLGVRSGSSVYVQSDDPIAYSLNVHSRENPYNSVIRPYGKHAFAMVKTDRLPARVTDDIHPWMLAWWLTVDHPYFAVTDAEGQFTIRDVPPGVQRLVVWHEAVGYINAGGAGGDEVMIRPEGLTEARFAITLARIISE